MPKWDTYDAKLRDELDLKMALYSAIIDRMDQNIGRVIEKLRTAGRLDNTLFLFMVDNGVPGTGCTIGEDSLLKTVVTLRHAWTTTRMGSTWRLVLQSGRGWANLSNAPFRMYKRYTHEGGVATPLIVHWPDGLKDQNKLRHTPSHIIDIAPTCLNAAGLSTKGMEGQTLLPVFTKDSTQPRTLFWEHEGNRAVRQGDYKLVAQHNTPWELYNMRKDRNELHDLSRSMPQKAAELKKLYEAWAHCGCQTVGRSQRHPEKESAEKVRPARLLAQFNDREDGAVIGRHSFG